MAMWDGSYEVDTKYDEDGQETDDISIGIDGKPYKTDDGSSTMKLVYDADGRIIERQFLFGNDLAKRIHGVTRDYSIIKYGYDENNRVTALSFWETEEKPVDGTILIYDSVSAHRVVLMYNGATIVEEKYFKFGATEPFRVIDCLKKEYLTSSGISTTRNEN
jgi:YD repeat-containing protein